MRVLVAKDEKRLAAGLRNGLEAEGFAVDVALDGTDGLWTARDKLDRQGGLQSIARVRLGVSAGSR